MPSDLSCAGAGAAAASAADDAGAAPAGARCAAGATPLRPAPLPATAPATHPAARRAALRLLAAALLAALPVAWLLPVASAWENGLLENLQALMLLGGAVAAWRFARASSGACAALGHAAMPVWLILAVRELSWGAAVLAAPLDMRWSGPVYSSSVLSYKPLVYPAVALVLLACLVVALRGRVPALVKPLLPSARFAWAELAVVGAALVLSALAEGNLPGLGLAAQLGQRVLVLEEWAETIAYLALAAAQWQLFAALRQPPAPPGAAHHLRAP